MNTSHFPRPALCAFIALSLIHTIAAIAPARAAGGNRADNARRNAASLHGSVPADPEGTSITNYLWDGGGGNDNFSTPANWNPDIAPTNDGSAFLRFAGSTRLSPMAETAYIVYGIRFESNASAFTLSGGALTLFGGGITQNSANEQTIDNSVTLTLGTQSLSFGSGAGTLTFGNDFIIGANGGTATLNVSAGAVTVTNTGFASYLGLNGGTGTLNLSGTANLTSARGIYLGHTGTGTINQSGGSLSVTAGILYLAFRGDSVGTYALSGSTSTLTAGSVNIGYRGTGTFTQSGGTLTASGITLGQVLVNTNSAGTYNLNGGTLHTDSVVTGAAGSSGTSTFNFNGGTLQAGVDNATFLQGLTTANVRNGGAKIDTADFNVTIAQALLHSGISGDATTDGGLSKTGTGALTLNGTNTYTGGTTVGGGTLVVGTAGALGTAGLVDIASGATLDFTSLSGSAYTLASGRTLQNRGTVSGNLTVASGATLLGAGTLNGALTVASGGLVLLTSGTLTVNGTLTNSGTMRFARGASLAVAGSGSTFVNNGTLDIITGSFTVPAGGFTNNGVVLDSRVVKVKSVSRTSGSVSVSIDSYTGHLFRLQRNDSLNSATFANITGVPAQGSPTGSVITFTDNNPAADKGFYRVIVDEI